MKAVINRISRIVALALVIACLFGVVVTATNISDFTDVPERAWYRPELEYAVDHGIIKGTSENTFSPNVFMSRGEFVTMLGRAVCAEGEDGNAFNDVSDGSYYGPYAYWALVNGIVYGSTENTFSPEASITRQDMATMVGRMLNEYNYAFPDSAEAVEEFADKEAIAEYAKEHVEELRRYGILKGDEKENMNPRSTMTRAEGVAIIVRVEKAIAKMTESTEEGSQDESVNKEPPTPEVNPYAKELVAVAEEIKSRFGMVGRLIIPDLGVNVALFDTEVGIDSQVLVDRADSACMFPSGIFGNEALIGDHNYQGFEAIKDAEVNKSIAYINDGNKYTSYICTEIGIGTRGTYTLYNKNGESLFDKTSGGIIMYTCNFVKNSITYTIWQPYYG